MDLTGDGKVSLHEFRKAVKLWMDPFRRSNTQRLLRGDTLRTYVENQEAGRGNQEPIVRSNTEVREYMTTRLTKPDPLETEHISPYDGEVEAVEVVTEHVERNL